MATSTRRPQRPLAPPARRLPPARRGGSPLRRWRRIALLTVAFCLIPVLVSYVSAMSQRSDSSLGVRTVEWLRDNGARGLVTQVEDIYYSLTAPSKGGPALKALPKQAALAAIRARRRASHFEPPRIRPVIHPALPGEGVWHSTFADGGRYPPVLITTFRPEPSYPRLVAGVAWIDHTRTSTWLYPGISEPAVSMPDRGPEQVPLDRRPGLVATFNSAFKLEDSGGGVAIGGHTYAPMRPGIATILRYRNGTTDVVAWNGGSDVPANVIYARQNLPLIVNDGKPNPNLSNGPEWGVTVGNSIQVWRSSVGVDSHGNLIYAAANDQTVASLARMMIRAHAVRAMELDINSYWPSFITYRLPGARQAANLLPDMVRSPLRYLTPDDRDFFAVYVR